jgi:hypothetical protein
LLLLLLLLPLLLLLLWPAVRNRGRGSSGSGGSSNRGPRNILAEAILVALQHAVEGEQCFQTIAIMGGKESGRSGECGYEKKTTRFWSGYTLQFPLTS